MFSVLPDTLRNVERRRWAHMFNVASAGTFGGFDTIHADIAAARRVAGGDVLSGSSGSVMTCFRVITCT